MNVVNPNNTIGSPLGFIAFSRTYALREAQGDRFLDAHHELVEGAGLGVAALQGRDGGDVVAVLIHFHDDVEFPVHGRILLHPARPARGKGRVGIRAGRHPGLQGRVVANPSALRLLGLRFLSECGFCGR